MGGEWAFASGTSTLPCGAGRPVSGPIGSGLTLTVDVGVFDASAASHTQFLLSPSLPSSLGELHCGILSCPVCEN